MPEKPSPKPAIDLDQSETLHRRLQLRVLVGTVLTSLLIGAVFSVNQYKSDIKQLETELLWDVELQTTALASEIARLKNVAAQVTSRTRAREELERYNQRLRPLESLVAFSTPILADAMRLAPDILAITRLDVDGNVLVEVGQSIPKKLLPSNFHADSIELGEPREIDGRQLLVISAPIMDRKNNKVGIDFVTFDCTRLSTIMHRFFRRHDRSGNVRITALRPEGRQYFLESGAADSGAFDRLLSDSFRRSLELAEQDLRTVEQTGHAKIIAHRRIDGTNWIFLFSEDSDDFLAPARLHAIHTILAIFLLASIGGALCLMVIRPLSGRISLETRAVLDLLSERETLLHRAQASEAKLNKAQQVSHTGSWELDLEKHTLWWSDEVYRICEIDANDFEPSYEGFLGLVHPDDRDSVNKAYTDSITKKTPYAIVHRLQLPGGKLKFVSECCETFYDDTGKPLRSVGTVQDITERHRQELEKNRLHGMLTALVEGSSDAIYVKDIEGRYLLANRALSDLLARSTDEIVGADDFDLFPKESAKQFRSDDRRIMQRGQTETYEEPIVTNESALAYLTTKGPLLINGKTHGVFGIARDISARKRAELRWQAQQHYFRSMDRVAHALSAGNDLDKVIQSLVETILSVFQADRAWLLYPCDPETKYCRVPVEATQPDFPGALHEGTPIPMDEVSASLMREALASDGAVTMTLEFDETDAPVWVRHFRIRSLMVFALRPSSDRCWLMGLHQCRDVRQWSDAEKRLFQAIGQRVEDTLERLLLTKRLRDDIAERERVQLKLRESETRMALLLNTLPYGVQENDAEGMITYSNIAHHRILGYEPGELIGRKIWDFQTDSSEKIKLRDYIANLIAEQPTPTPYVTRNIAKDGREVMLEIIWDYQRDADGAIIGFISVISDITERAQRETALQESEQRFHAIFDNALDGILVVDATTKRFFDGNATLCRMLGFPHRELSQLCVPDIHPAEELDNVLEKFEKQRRGEMMLAEDVPVLRKDGSLFFADISAAPFTLDGHPYLVGLFRDTTERKRSDEALRASEERFRTLAESSPAGIFLSDANGDCIYANERCAQLVGVPLAEFLGPNWHASIHLDDHQRVTGAWKDAVDGKTIFRQEFRWRHGDGGIVWTLGLAVPVLGSNNQVTGFVASLVDLTQQRETERELARSAAEWTQAMDQFDDAICLIDLKGRLLRANRVFYKMIGFDAQYSVGRSIAKLLHPDREPEHCMICQARKARAEATWILEPDNPFNPSKHPVEITLKLVRDSDDAPIAMFLSLRDLSASRRIEERLRLSASVFENTAEGVMITDSSGTIVDVNRAFTEILGYSREEVLGQNPRIWKSGRHGESFFRGMWRSLRETGQWRGELWNRRKNGAVFPMWLTISNVVDENGMLTHFVGVFSDISHIKDSQEQLDYLAHHDALTDLPNRLLLNERLEQAILHAERHESKFAVIFLDLDRFKHINDSLGHPAGDRLLQTVATLLQHALRQDDTVSRIGGDEFVMLLQDIVQPQNAARAAEKLMAAFSQPLILDEQEIRVSASLGISIYPRDGTDPATLLRNADAAMYRAKEEGRNTYQFYTEELTRNAFERVLLENSLRQAVTRGELHLLFQPQIELHSERIIGVEALVRWLHPELGTISPAKFIPLAEECGLIHPIGDWVMHAACAQAKRWLDQGIDFGRMSVNIAGPQIQRGGLVDCVKNALAESRLDASRLELEVTEGFIMQQAKFAINQLDDLRQLGITLAIDDFGTGYSSLSYLKKLPIHKLKIDQSFVRDIPSDPNDMAICNAVIALGKSLGLKVIAEGVETPAQADYLRHAKCDEAQGYLFGKPLEPEAFEEQFFASVPDDVCE